MNAPLADNQEHKDEKDASSKIQKADDYFENGNTNLLIGGGVAAYGATLATTAGIVCPTCLIAAPLFLGWGAVQKYQIRKVSKDGEHPKD